MRVGLIGCGHHGRNAVAPAFQTVATKAKLVAACDVSQDLVNQVQGVARYTDFRQMFAREKLDTIYVATLSDTHAAITLEALKAGYHVICEKPMANGLADCKAMADAARELNRRLFINFETRLYGHMRQIRQWIADGRLGRVEAVHLNSLWDGHKNTGELAERRGRLLKMAGGLDCGIHKLDLARYFAGGARWRTIKALGAWYGEAFTFPPHIAVLGRLENGVMVTVNASLGYASQIKPRPMNDGLNIVGDRGIVAINNDHDSLEESAASKNPVRLITDSGVEKIAQIKSTHVAMIGELADLVAGVVMDGQPAPLELATGDDGVQAQWATETANQQAASERAVGAE
jgi:predicted dehydrogenase